MFRPALIAFLAVAGSAASAPAVTEVEGMIQPGYWEVTNKLSAVISQTKKEKRCITPAEVSKFMMGPSNRHYACTYPTRSFKNGQISLKGSCASKKGRQVAIEAKGSYSPTTFKLVADVDTSYAGIPLGGRASTEARRIGDVCPTDAKRG